ncbi:MAG: hypothetical protein KJ614_03760 [Gammaproteobacteria bacterium]|uniref:hypothetical protein n=1 Tax=Rhodoferax sp. TaxID=50421 RepID=UPI001847FE41|nr:hypothetical protein [Rhodoferax sp.]MBU3898034.1 hypothetical protein [Gammaproteobacteria bacterium]MBA3058533.1 type II toxin-antitoxin system VapC family toxin [Rhodoferax sp.]MBU3999209.1 hypothetical protein [Gammaproteobacteria bacterium]MBU4081772.1 hypothetical protein [Gammaproteobacteria bacterium]MBU4112892.1 hypothetical protein [Gammaproteobacteria bacterium]
MIALDTNILVRVLINDDKLQAAQATQLIEANACFVPLTVADAVHLAAAEGCEALYTFDKKLIALAINLTPACRSPELLS